MRSTAGGILFLSELRRRGGVHAFLATVFTFATAALVVMLGSVNGVYASIGVELQDTLSSDWRLADGNAGGLAEGHFVEGAGATAERIEAAVPGARVVPRIEVPGLFLHTEQYEDWDASLLIGIDPRADPDVARVADRLIAGRLVRDEEIWQNGTAYAEVVVGRAMLEALGMTVYDGDVVRPENVMRMSAGRFSLEAGAIRPLIRWAVVVGVVDTGFGPVDRHTVYAHLGMVRSLLRMDFDDEPANVLLVRAPEDAPVAAAARAERLNATSAREFRDGYLAAVFEPVRAFTTVVSAVVLVLAGGWAAHVAAAALLADKRRVAVLRALGVPTRLLLGPATAIIVLAGAVGAAAGFVLGILVGVGIEAADVRFGSGFRLLFDVPLGAVVLVVLAVVVTGAVAAAGAGLALRRVPVTDALRD